MLYFVGSGRSGTTLINGILGSVPGVFAGGELRYVWQRGVVENHLCSCGQPFDRCPLWTEVMDRLRARTAPGAKPERVGVDLQRRLRLRKVPAMLARWAVGRPAVTGHPDDRMIDALYHVVAEVTGARVLVDSSKLPPYGMLVSQFPGIDVRVLHVVRDARATAYSWSRHKRARTTDDDELMPRQTLTKSSALWLVWNLVPLVRWAGRPHYLRLRYEDFAADPAGAMRQVCEFAGLDAGELPFVAADRVLIAPGHVVAGNPDRHRTGEVHIREDEQWRRAMRVGDRFAVTAIAAIGLATFRYPLSSRRVGIGRGSPDL